MSALEDTICSSSLLVQLVWWLLLVDTLDYSETKAVLHCAYIHIISMDVCVCLFMSVLIYESRRRVNDVII